MANTPSAKKRARQAESRRRRNASKRSMMRTLVKNVLKAVDAGDKAAAQVAFRLAESNLDKMVVKGFIHKNNAARKKHRLFLKVKAMAA